MADAPRPVLSGNDLRLRIDPRSWPPAATEVLLLGPRICRLHRPQPLLRQDPTPRPPPPYPDSEAHLLRQTPLPRRRPRRAARQGRAAHKPNQDAPTALRVRRSVADAIPLHPAFARAREPVAPKARRSDSRRAAADSERSAMFRSAALPHQRGNRAVDTP